MINRRIQLEEERLHSLGFDTIVSTESFTIGNSTTMFDLGNDTFILTGIRMSKDDIMGNASKIQLISPTDAIEGSANELSQLGTSILKLFRKHLIVKTTINGARDVGAISPYRLDFIKITPIKKQ